MTIMAQGITEKREVSISNNHHCHRLATMTTTHHDHDHEDQDDIMRGDDSPPLQNHPGTENPENPNEFHMVAERSPPADHQPPQEGAMTIYPSSPAASSSLGYSASQYSISFLPLQHLEHPDPHELPDELWTSPSSSSGGGPPEASDEQLDRLYESHPRLHRESREAADHQLTQPLGGAISPALSGMSSESTSRQEPPTMTIRPIGAPLSSGASSLLAFSRTSVHSKPSVLHCQYQQPNQEEEHHRPHQHLYLKYVLGNNHCLPHLVHHWLLHNLLHQPLLDHYIMKCTFNLEKLNVHNLWRSTHHCR